MRSIQIIQNYATDNYAYNTTTVSCKEGRYIHVNSNSSSKTSKNNRRYIDSYSNKQQYHRYSPCPCFPFNNPKDTARYPIPTANMIAPIITKTKPVIYDINKDPTATPPIPAKSDRIPPIIIKIAITVTPVGRLFISKSSTLSEGVNIHIYFYVYITQEIHRYLSGFGILSMFTAKIL